MAEQQTTSNSSAFNDAKGLLDDAEAVLVSASNGLSISEGYDIFATDAAFKKNFTDFEKKYGVHSILEAVQTLRGEAKQSFLARLRTYLVDDYVPTPAFASLKKLLAGKDWFVITSNADTHFELSGFDPQRIWEIEGTFFGNRPQSASWTAQQNRFNDFLRRNADKKTVQLELGIGPANRLIKSQLMQIVSELPAWSFVTLNLHGQTAVQPNIRDKSVVLEGDVTSSLARLVSAQADADFVAKVDRTRNAFDYENLVMATQENYDRYYPVYANKGTAVPLSDRKPAPYEEQIRTFARKIEEADHIVVGGASGLSAAGGGDFYYTDTPSFYKHFSRFAKKYGIKGAFAGMRYPWKSREEFWAYLATFLHTTLSAPIRKPYLDLQKMLKGKSYFILTTNQDTQAIKAFPENKVAEIQGDHRYFQCSRGCTDRIWDATESIQKMYDSLGDNGTAIPSSLIPRCPACGAEAFPWVRGYGNFLEGTRYHEEYAKISHDIEEHKDEKILFLELGVGRLTPMFIQEPFWELTRALPDAFDVMVNRDYYFVPKAIEDKSIAIKADLAKVLDDVLAQMEKDGARK